MVAALRRQHAHAPCHLEQRERGAHLGLRVGRGGHAQRVHLSRDGGEGLLAATTSCGAVRLRLTSVLGRS